MVPKTVLWIDDQINDYSEFIDGMESRGLRVTPSESVEEGLGHLETQVYDIILLDLKMPGENGFDFLKRRLRETQAPVCVLSSYLHLDEYHKSLNSIQENIGIMDKDLPQPNSKAFDIFAEKIKELIARPPTEPPKRAEQVILENLEGVDPFEVTFKRYLNMPSPIKAVIRKEAEKIAHKTLLEEFHEGSGWVFLCGSAEHPVMTARLGEPPPHPSKIMAKAMELDRVPFQFSAPDTVDDIFTGGCEGPIDLSGYPTVRLVLYQRPFDIHFDTGSSFTFLSFEELNELHLLEKVSMPISGRRGHSTYEYVQQPVKATIKCQRNPSISKVIGVNARVVKNWRKGPYAVICPLTCKNYKEGESVLCRNRTGLIGRNLITENKMQISVCGSTNLTSYSMPRRAQSASRKKKPR